jgi:hypothetical protein
MKSTFTLIASILLGTTSLFAQLTANEAGKNYEDMDQVELVIVRNAEECLGHESSIVEWSEGSEARVAFLYHDSPQKNAATNFYNLSTIRDVLSEYSKEGFQIKSTSAENMTGKCNRIMRYSLAKRLEYSAKK